MTRKPPAPFEPELAFPATLLSRYLFFLGRRPVSAANAHYRASRIGALQSLAPWFDDEAIREPLLALNPSNLFRVAPALQTVLQPRLAYDLPRDLVTTAQAPSRATWEAMRRVAVIYGPAIGIGDEILAAPLPRALQALAPHATIEVFTAYDGLWSRIAPEQRTTCYRTLAALLERIRSGEDDAVVYVDFEPAGLVAAVAHEAEVKRFAELSIGTRSLALLDNVTRRLHRMPQSAENFYDVFAAMCRWLGAEPPAYESRVRRSGDPLIVVSPFTSKEEPSERLWRPLLTSALAGERVVIDTGPSAATRAFAISIRDALRVAGLRAQLAADGRAATLGEMLDVVAGADAAIAADSYLAHAAPRFGVTTLVVAREGLEDWRVPAPSSFYFRSEDDPGAIGEAMRLVLREPKRGSEAGALRAAASAVDFDGPLERLLDAWQCCLDAHNSVVAALPEWPRAFATLARDARYGRLMPRAPRPDGLADAELRAHLRQRFADCARSNLWKYVREPV